MLANEWRQTGIAAEGHNPVCCNRHGRHQGLVAVCCVDSAADKHPVGLRGAWLLAADQTNTDENDGAQGAIEHDLPLIFISGWVHSNASPRGSNTL